MQPLPHTYRVTADGAANGTISVKSHDVPDLVVAAPKEFDGPGDRWSPESLIAASVASCFVLTFRAIARASRLQWSELQCRVEGKLDRVDGVSRFTHWTTIATLSVPDGSDAELAKRTLEKAEQGCLVANSLSGTRSLQAQVRVEDVAEYLIGEFVD
jgi:organic hydroperoxide reductase OsmC/OhrA